jgi:hypothetical protein
MPLSVEDLRGHVSYSAWASQRLVHAASELSEAELLRDFQTPDRSVLGTLVHYAEFRTMPSKSRSNQGQPELMTLAGARVVGELGIVWSAAKGF